MHDPQNWDGYWQKERLACNVAYDHIASFFRRDIIRPYLNRFIWQNFAPGSRRAAGGCGSGEVDVDVTRRYTVTALDISLNALAIYQRIHRGHFSLVHGDVPAMDIPTESMDGVYSLGLLEHFPPEQIRRILGEFYAVLKPGGKAGSSGPRSTGRAYFSSRRGILRSTES